MFGEPTDVFDCGSCGGGSSRGGGDNAGDDTGTAPLNYRYNPQTKKPGVVGQQRQTLPNYNNGAKDEDAKSIIDIVDDYVMKPLAYCGGCGVGDDGDAGGSQKRQRRYPRFVAFPFRRKRSSNAVVGGGGGPLPLRRSRSSSSQPSAFNFYNNKRGRSAAPVRRRFKK